jgi:hypothetical protein
MEMKRMDVFFNGQELTFRTNNSGNYLFVGVSVNNQISCESGLDSLKRMKAAIRSYLRSEWEIEHEEPMPRIKYIPSPYTEWKP